MAPPLSTNTIIITTQRIIDKYVECRPSLTIKETENKTVFSLFRQNTPPWSRKASHLVQPFLLPVFFPLHKLLLVLISIREVMIWLWFGVSPQTMGVVSSFLPFTVLHCLSCTLLLAAKIQSMFPHRPIKANQWTSRKFAAESRKLGQSVPMNEWPQGKSLQQQ